MPSSSKRRGDDWPENDEIELLAQLDFLVDLPQQSSCLLTVDQREEADKQIILQLSEIIDGRYTPRQVRSKLWSLYAEGDASEYGAYNFSQVFRLGSSEMRALDDSTRARIKDKFENIRMWATRKKRSSIRPTPPKLTASPTPSAQRVHKRRRKPSRKPRYQTLSRTVTPCNTSIKRKNNSERIPGTSPSVVITSVKRERPSLTRRRVNSPLEWTEVADSMEEDSQESMSGEPPANDLLAPDTSRLDYPPTTVQEVPKPPQLISGIMLDIQEHEDLVHEGTYWRQKCEQVEVENARLKRESRERKALTAKTQTASFSLVAEINGKNARIADLESQVNRLAFLQPNLDLESGDLNAEILDNIQKNASALAKRIAAIDLISGLEYPIQRTFECSSDLIELVHLALGDNSHGYRINDLIDPGIPPPQFIQALTGAAVCEKVFRPDFRCIEMQKTPLVDEYRRLIVAAYDSNVLRSLDFAAHRSIIKSDRFQEMVLPRKAKGLAERHLDVLAPFIAEKEKAECTGELRWRLEGIFEAALHLKVLIMTTKDKFEWIWPAPGSDFDVDTMQTARPRRQEFDQYNQTDSPRVVLPVAPGLRIYSHDRQMVDYNGFREMDDYVDGQRSVAAKSMVYI